MTITITKAWIAMFADTGSCTDEILTQHKGRAPAGMDRHAATKCWLGNMIALRPSIDDVISAVGYT